MIVLDTNVISEFFRPRPSPQVVAWLDRRPIASVTTTTITVAELGYGIAIMPGGHRREALVESLAAWLAELPRPVLPFDDAAAETFGPLMAHRRAAGAPMGFADGQIAAVCRAHGAVLATRNTADFVGTGVELADPWAPTAS